MTTRPVELALIMLPDFGLPTVEPHVEATTYEARLAAAQQRAADAGLDALIVYGDREHFANLAYLTGYDPRFEEAILILVPGTIPTLLVGNEGLAYAAISPVMLERQLYQSFSLISQPRGSSEPLDRILHEAGIDRGKRVGFVGWKYFTPQDTPTPDAWIEVPAFLVDTVRQMGCAVRNATALFMEPESGLRAINEVDQLAVFEFASALGSQGLRNAIFHLHPGLTEYEAVELMRLNGYPTSCYPMILSGERTPLALASPSSRKLQVGDPIFGALSLWGSNNARGGFVVENAQGLPAGIRDYVDKLVVPYFRAVVEWYEHIGINVPGGELFEIIHRHLGDPFFGVGLNPGHLIHLDEWLSSPIYRGSTQRLRSGMAIQVDVIPATNTPYFTTNIEDGIALADEALRTAFAQKYPEAWGRIQQRRDFMQNTLGIRLKPEVLPFSNIPAYLPPYWLAPDMALRERGWG